MKSELKRRIRHLHREFTKRQSTLALAESCTGGLIASHVAALPGASVFFNGGVVSYADSAKRDVLKIPTRILKHSGAVSRETARLMAINARKVFKAEWAISVTGIAGPDGGTNSCPVGLVFFAVAGPKVVEVRRKIFKGNRHQVQMKATEESVALLMKLFLSEKVKK